jgi:hypothetical protein
MSHLQPPSVVRRITVILARGCVVLAISIEATASAEDVRTTNGHEYKDAQISRVEPDGIVITHSAGIVKIPFTELPRDSQKKYGYDPEKAQAYAEQLAQQQHALAASNQQTIERVNAEKSRQLEAAQKSAADEKRIKGAMKSLPNIQLSAVIKPFSYGENRTTVWLQEYQQYDTGLKHNPSSSSLDWVPVLDWRAVGKKYIAVIDERMPDSYESGDTAVVTLYKIGHTGDFSRNPLFTTNADKALRILAGN